MYKNRFHSTNIKQHGKKLTGNPGGIPWNTEKACHEKIARRIFQQIHLDPEGNRSS